jgi:TPR repeat protein
VIRTTTTSPPSTDTIALDYCSTAMPQIIARAHAGDWLACYLYAYSLHQGFGCAVDIDAARHWYTRATALYDLPVANYNLALLVDPAFDPNSLRPPSHQAMLYLERAAEVQQHVLAQYLLATILLSYYPQSQSQSSLESLRSRALALLHRAADQHLPQALLQLGLLYRTGEHGLAVDAVHARKLILQAAQLWLPAAQTILANMLRKGEGGPCDVTGAYHWLLLAARQNYLPALLPLGLLRLEVFGNEFEARDLFLQAVASTNDPRAAYVCATCLFLTHSLTHSLAHSLALALRNLVGSIHHHILFHAIMSKLPNGSNLPHVQIVSHTVKLLPRPCMRLGVFTRMSLLLLLVLANWITTRPLCGMLVLEHWITLRLPSTILHCYLVLPTLQLCCSLSLSLSLSMCVCVLIEFKVLTFVYPTIQREKCVGVNGFISICHVPCVTSYKLFLH